VLTIPWAGEALTLLPERAAWLAHHHTLLIADAHIGKAASFRRLGLPVPQGSTQETLRLLSAVILRTGVRRLVFLGDFLHSAQARTASTLEALTLWRARHAELSVTLVRGNHDRRAGDPPEQLGFELVEAPLYLGAVALCHDADTPAERPVLAGHQHPCIRLRGGGSGNGSVRLPCFHFTTERGVLPAFGAFTGMQVIQRQPADQVFAIAGDEVLAVP
jgi:uncharacterized protein